jgi:hypothetical protein
MDYRLLLFKYINLVGFEEGITFANRAAEPEFTAEEIAALMEIDGMKEYVPQPRDHGKDDARPAPASHP